MGFLYKRQGETITIDTDTGLYFVPAGKLLYADVPDGYAPSETASPHQNDMNPPKQPNLSEKPTPSLAQRICDIHQIDRNLLLSKNADYGDVWASDAIEDTYLLDQVVVKIMRIKSLRAKGGEPNHESIADSLRDARNYLVLAELRLLEEY